MTRGWLEVSGPSVVGVVRVVEVVGGRRMSTDSDLQAWPEVPSIAHFCSLFR